MARKTRYTYDIETIITNDKKWKIAIYIRLSKEDGNTVSYSVTNQKEFLVDYVENVIKNYISYKIYIDDGETGIDTDRVQFQNLLKDMNNAEINCIIVKDLSRLSRDYLEIGNFLEKEFVEKNIRFISIGEDLDSFLNPDRINSLIVRFTSLINDDFCQRTSHKIKTILNFKKRKGLFVGSFAPYGYLKNINNRYVLSVDQEAANNIKYIFDSFVNKGMSKAMIAKKLTDMGILNPSNYKKSQGLKYYSPNSTPNSYAWSSRTITTILQNQMYLGDMVQGKTRLKSYKVHEVIAIDKEEWIIVENTHEPIIDKAIFENAQKLQKRDTRTAPKKNTLYLFSGLLRCNDCNKAMVRKKDRKDNIFYRCRTYTNLGKKHCASHNINKKKIILAIQSVIKLLIQLTVHYESTIVKINLDTTIKKHYKYIDSKIKKENEELQKNFFLNEVLYKDWKTGDITKEEYKRYKQSYDEKIINNNKVIENLNNEKNKLNDSFNKTDPFLKSFIKDRYIENIDREILVDFIDCIYIADNADIIVRFKFRDELMRMNLLTEDSK